MNWNKYGEVINGNDTYREIANHLLNGKTVGIGWTDESFTHYDILFHLGMDVKAGDFQRGLKQYYLYVSIIDHTSMGFTTDSTKHNEYIKEKLRIHNETGDKLSELINGIIISMKESGETYV